MKIQAHRVGFLGSEGVRQILSSCQQRGWKGGRTNLLRFGYKSVVLKRKRRDRRKTEEAIVLLDTGECSEREQVLIIDKRKNDRDYEG